MERPVAGILIMAFPDPHVDMRFVLDAKKFPERLGLVPHVFGGGDQPAGAAMLAMIQKWLEQRFQRFGTDESDGHIKGVAVLQLVAQRCSHGVMKLVRDKFRRKRARGVGIAMDETGGYILKQGIGGSEFGIRMRGFELHGELISLQDPWWRCAERHPGRPAPSPARAYRREGPTGSRGVPSIAACR